MKSIAAKSQSQRNMKVLVVAAAIVPSLSIGVLRPMLSMERSDLLRWRLTFEGRWTLEEIRWADIVVFCRNQSVDAYAAALVARHEGKKIIFEIDDNFFEMPLNTSLGKRHRDPAALHTTRRLFELADVTRVYNSEMAHLARRFGAEVRQSNVYFDHSLTKSITPKRDAVVRIAFASGRSPDAMLDVALEEALNDIIEAYPNKVEVHYWRPPGRVLSKRAQVVVNSGTANYNQFIRKFYGAGYDIGLAPLLNSRFYRSKTNSKYREYGGCRIAGVYSSVSPYTDCVVDGQNGLLVDNSRGSWRGAISRLVEDEVLRTQIKDRAYEDVLENYNYQSYLDGWRETLELALASDKGRPDIKPLLYHRNLAISAEAQQCPLGEPTDLQVSSIRGGEWGARTQFTTNFIDAFGDSDALEGPGVVNWTVANASHLDQNTVRQLHEAGIKVICDGRGLGLEGLGRLADALRAVGNDVGIVICNVEQLDGMVPMSRDEELEGVNDPIYPSPQRFRTEFGYGVAAPSGNPILSEASLIGPRAVWLEIMDTISAFEEIGKPPILKVPRWSRYIPVEYVKYASPNLVAHLLVLRISAWIQRVRWQYFRRTIV